MDVRLRPKADIEKRKGDLVSGSSSALLMAGPSGVGPFHSREWRVGFSAQLVEGGTNGPYWLFLDEKGRERILHLDGLDPQTVLRSAVLILSYSLGSENLRGWLEESENIYTDESGDTQIAPFWEMADEVLAVCARELSVAARLGLVRLDDLSIWGEEVSKQLLELGFDVQTFVPGA